MHLRLAALILAVMGSGLWLASFSQFAAGKDPAPPAVPAPSAAPAPVAPANPAAPADEAAPAGEKPAPLAASQDVISRRYKRFEETLLKISETLRKTDPDRSALLMRVIGRSKQEGISRQMADLIELLKQDQLGDAVERQGELVTQLMGLLDLLSSEDRKKEIAAEKARIEKHLKELNRLIAEEKDVRAATERGEPSDGLAGRQKKIADKTAELGKAIDREDAEKNAKDKESDKKPNEANPEDGQPGEAKPGEAKPGEGKPNEGKPSEGKPGEEKPGESKPGEGKPSEGKPSEGKPSEGKPSEGKPSEGKPSEGKPSEGKPSESQPSQPSQSTPGRENIEAARKEMENALEKLKQKGQHDASDHQDEALRELAKAKEKFEEILRQLREEERDRLLAALEARFQRMLAAQLAVYDGTVKLDKTPQPERESRHAAKSVQLSRQEDEIAIEATKTITLLREEGTAVAFPEAVEQMRDDMRIVGGRLERADVGELVQAIEKDIIAALEEMIEALQKEMEKKDQKPPPNQQQQQQEPQDPSLVDQLSELKMLRSLQLRVNHRTKRLGRLVEGEQALQPDIVSQLQNLAERQARIQQATYDLATGKNK